MTQFSNIETTNQVFYFTPKFFHCRNHLKVVEKFKRFPHRNEIHGRKSTPEEVKFLDDPAFRFDLPLVFKEDGTVTFAPTEEFNNRQQLVEDILENED